jgi:hypothetical protein
MPARRREAALIPKPSLHSRGLLACAVLIASIFASPSAFAGPLENGANQASHVLPQVTETVGAAPSVPPTPQSSTPSASSGHSNGAPPPAAPPGPSPPPLRTSPAAAGKPPVEVPVAPPRSRGTGPVKLPQADSSRPTPAPAGGSAGAGVDLPTADLAAGAGKSSGAFPSSTREGTSRSPASNREGFGQGPSGRDVRRPGVKAGSVGSARTLPVPRWIAHVWPAIVVAAPVKLLASFLSGDDVASLLPVAAVLRVLSPPVDGGAGGAARLAKHSSVADSPSAGPPPFGVSDRDIAPIVFLALVAVLTTLLVLALRQELRAMRRWPLP